MRTVSALSAAVMLASATLLSAAPLQFGVTDLGGLSSSPVPAGFNGSKAYGISPTNVVAGTSYTTGNLSLNGLTYDASGTPVAHVTYAIAGGSSSEAMAIGGASAHPNTVVGFSATSSRSVTHAFAGQGSATDIHSLIATGPFAGSTNSRAFGINTHDDIVGQASVGSSYQAFYLPGSGGAPSAIPKITGSIYTNSLATAVNGSGSVVGFDYTGGWTYNLSGSIAGGTTHPEAFSWTSGGGTVNLGTLGGTDSIATSINAAGTIVGQSTLLVGDVLSAKGHAFVYSGGSMTALPELTGATESIADDIDDAGDIVGSVMIGAVPQAFLYDGTTMINLNTPSITASGWVLKEATSINADGFIAGYGTHDGVTTAFLLSPISGAPVTPEPTTAALLGLGAIGMIAKRRR